jgi:putative CocE/NonD family hydrolase
MLGTLPLNQLEALRKVAPFYFDWLSHPPEDGWWDWCELRNKYSGVQAAVLNFSGWYDDNYGPEGATTNFLGLREARAGEADPRTALVIGPWVHGVGATSQTKAGDREFSQSAAINYDEIVLRWMDHYLRGIDNGVDRAKPVRYYVMGDNQWSEADTWPPAAKATPYYLAGNSRLSKRAPEAAEQFTVFTSDPSDPVVNAYSQSGAHDYRRLQQRGDVLTFDSAPLERSTEVTGSIQARIYLSCDCLDTDLWVRLLDVSSDGTALNLMSPGLDVLRASYRNPPRGRQLLSPGHTYKLDLNNLMTSNVFEKGHRIRIQVSTTFFANFSRNLHSGELETTSARMQKATIRIYHDHRHPSRIVLPVVQH